ncbi:uncharacterized protein LOC118187606 isoform X2 [Stegodyphus dumicola]|uniref:uncharacterized protein LOC118187606 isoform X2 n=1 Tax=Stegodyphus dumicola TaxID=202533 RepID=UPI0015AA68A2|nr:uncharacterized protein LOC118187606 isoform X2 [Stegodyphus dumicola]
MWFLFFAFLFTLCSGQPDSDMCDLGPFKKCKQMTQVGSFPETEEGLAEVCPLFKEYIGCLNVYDQSCEVTIFPNPGQYESLIGAIDDVCDRDSHLHRVFLESIPCYKHVSNSYRKVCPSRELLFTALELYDIQNPIAEITDDTEIKSLRFWKLNSCLYQVYMVSCMADYAAAECTNDARQSTVDLARRSYYLDDECPQGYAETLLSIVPELDLDESLKKTLYRTLEGLKRS